MYTRPEFKEHNIIANSPEEDSFWLIFTHTTDLEAPNEEAARKVSRAQLDKEALLPLVRAKKSNDTYLLDGQYVDRGGERYFTAQKMHLEEDEKEAGISGLHTEHVTPMTEAAVAILLAD